MARTMVEIRNVKSVADDIADELLVIESALRNCEKIVDENVGVENRWSGQRANDFKAKFTKVASDFKEYVNQINGYVLYINKVYEKFSAYEENK